MSIPAPSSEILIFILLFNLSSCFNFTQGKDLYKNENTNKILIDSIVQKKTIDRITDNNFKTFISQFKNAVLPFKIAFMSDYTNHIKYLIINADIKQYLIKGNKNSINIKEDEIKPICVFNSDDNFIAVVYSQSMDDPAEPASPMVKGVLAIFTLDGKLISSLVICLNKSNLESGIRCSIENHFDIEIRSYYSKFVSDAQKSDNLTYNVIKEYYNIDNQGNIKLKNKITVKTNIKDNYQHFIGIIGKLMESI